MAGSILEVEEPIKLKTTKLVFIAFQLSTRLGDQEQWLNGYASVFSM
jgi:hypothetical protein